MTAGIRVEPATSDRWADIATLLGGDGEVGCWCQSWRGSNDAKLGLPKRSNRERLQAELDDGAYVPGLIAYVDDEPAGWLGFGPRGAMPRLSGSGKIPALDDRPVWSIGCFRIRAGYRRRGVATALLAAAVEHAQRVGAPGIEAYPIDPEGARVDVAFGFVGFTPMFESAGFRRARLTDAHSAGRPRWLMRLDFEPVQA